MNDRSLGILLMFLTVIFWGISFVSTKIILVFIPPITIGFIRFIIAAVILIFLIRNVTKYSKEDFVYLVLAGFLGITSYFLFENVALKYTTATNAALIAATVPIFYLMVSDIMEKKIPSKIKYFGSLIGLFGVFILILNGKFVLELNPLGDILMLGAVFTWVLYTFVIQKLQKHDDLKVTRDMTLIGAVLFIPFTIVELGSNGMFDFTILLNPYIAFSILYLAIFCSAIAYLFWNMSIRLAGASTTTNGIYFIPIVAMIADALLLKNIPNIYAILGAVLVLFGVYISEKGDKLKIKL
ncbi:drug/metabolite transporter (DMT)-like permease [Methanococcus maripaludis]|uniref:Drug/metabolite transporter (DMT)-like permease n=1 Tax=Methanococcus maripaludis TaxID=39152 RepID=A0A7J9P2Y3_METMI|nr:DMT family transporter [Methanococcus maripaludis]MBA2841196.1 drug/metabolite transporter (DMT)-like permease [Methanococcus maripaludis]MBA2853753.1 drug/metabolite transporter (DMT)-like permease [Methanococcus maripaludis]MBA2869534.1 drug/metabolite transporter (DMT)-like permease [Methanococcus maripaludis]